MNKTFAEYATSTAFRIDLTKRQCHELLRLKQGGRAATFMDMGCLRQLEKRGLLSWSYNEEGKAFKFNGLTFAGQLVAQMLGEAGLTLENTRTLATMHSDYTEKAA